MTWLAGLAVAAAAVAVGGGAGEPVPLRGQPLSESMGLRLLVADDPPFVLDVDSGRSTRVRGLTRLSSVSVSSAAGKAGVVIAGEEVFAVRGRAAHVTRLGPARDAVPSPGGRSVWLKTGAGGTSCMLREVRLDGTATGARSRTPCASLIQPGGSVGVVAGRTSVVDPATGRVRYRSRWGILAAAGQKLVLAGPGRQLTLVDVTTRAERRLSWPSIVTYTDRPAVDPRGRYVVLAFANPAWPDERGDTAGQVMDAWLLDTRTAELTQVPGMPAFVGLKTTSMEWTSDGRLVLLGEDDRRGFVAVWRPGQARLSVKTVKLPRRVGYSDSFAPLR